MKKKYPIGVDDYKELIDNDCYFVDKTLMIRDIIDDGSKVLLFTRPRRFGKTLNMSMLYYFFNKSDKDMSYLFRDKQIWECGESFRQHQGRYPVIYLTLKDWKPKTWEMGYQRIVSDIANLYIRHNYLIESECLTVDEKLVFSRMCGKKAAADELETSLKFLSALMAKHHNEKVIILLDEYDSLLNQAYAKGFYEDAIAFLRMFLGSAFKNNIDLHKGLLTGIFKVAKESIFSDMNNLTVCSVLDDQFSEYFGFLHQEILEMLTYFDCAAQADLVAEWYNGYAFGETQLTTIYNPWSILMYLRNRTLKSYWVNTSGNVIVKEMVTASTKAFQYEIEDLIHGKILENKPVNQFLVYGDIGLSDENIWSFLVTSGYLKVVAVRSNEAEITYCDLAIPNQEVYSFYRGMYRTWLRETVKYDTADNLLKLLVTGEIEAFEMRFSEIVNRVVSMHDVGQNTAESFYHAFTLGMLISLEKDYIVRSNRESGEGRYDVMIMPKDPTRKGVIIEFKRISVKSKSSLKTMAKAALAQIETQQYETELRANGVTDILKIGIAFKGKAIRIETK